MFCRDCGTENDDNAKFCRNCGLPIVPVEETVSPTFSEKTEEEATPSAAMPETPVTESAATPETPVTEKATASQTTGQAIGGQQTGSQTGMPYGQPGPQAAYAAQGNAANPTSASAIVSLILGIVSVVCCCTVMISIGCGIAAICVAVSDRKKNGSSGLTTAGLVLGIVGVSLSVICIIWVFASGEFGRMMDAIRTGRLQEYLNHLGDWGWNSYGF